MAIYLPEKCLRGRCDCQPYAQIAADELDDQDKSSSYICVGKNDGSDRQVAQDEYTLCWKNSFVDERTHWDKRDLTDTASVIVQSLSVIGNLEASE